MKNNIAKKLESIGGIEKNLSCSDNKKQKEISFLSLEIMLKALIPRSYKNFYIDFGAFSFLEPVCVDCFDSNQLITKNNKVIVGDFYCLEGDDRSSVNRILAFQEQLPVGLLPICDGELGDIICISLRKEDIGYVYYFHHESKPGNDLLLIAKKFEDFISGLQLYKGDIGDDELVKKMKMELSPQMLALLKLSGHGPRK